MSYPNSNLNIPNQPPQGYLQHQTPLPQYQTTGQWQVQSQPLYALQNQISGPQDGQLQTQYGLYQPQMPYQQQGQLQPQYSCTQDQRLVPQPVPGQAYPSGAYQTLGQPQSQIQAQQGFSQYQPPVPQQRPAQAYDGWANQTLGQPQSQLQAQQGYQTQMAAQHQSQALMILDYEIRIQQPPLAMLNQPALTRPRSPPSLFGVATQYYHSPTNAIPVRANPIDSTPIQNDPSMQVPPALSRQPEVTTREDLRARFDRNVPSINALPTYGELAPWSPRPFPTASVLEEQKGDHRIPLLKKAGFQTRNG